MCSVELVVGLESGALCVGAHIVCWQSVIVVERGAGGSCEIGRGKRRGDALKHWDSQTSIYALASWHGRSA